MRRVSRRLAIRGLLRRATYHLGQLRGVTLGAIGLPKAEIHYLLVAVAFNVARGTNLSLCVPMVVVGAKNWVG